MPVICCEAFSSLSVVSWYGSVLSLRYPCIQRLGIILIPEATFVPNFASFVASIAGLAHGKNHVLNQSLTHSPAYFMPREPKLLLQN